MVLVALGGVWAPLVVIIPSFPFNGFLSLAVFHQQTITNKMLRAAAMIAVLFIHLIIL